MKIQVNDLLEKVEAGVAKLGYEGKEAAIITNVLLHAKLRGKDQILTNLFTGGIPRTEEIQPYKEVRHEKGGAQVSGGNPMVATLNAATLACELAGKHGIAIVGSNHVFASAGAYDYFVRQMAATGFIGIMGVGTSPLVAPTGSSEPKLGSNPFCYAFPTGAQPIVFETLMTDVLDGSSATFKGFGLSLLVQLLAGPFSGASFAGVEGDKGTGTFVLAIDPTLLVGRDQYYQTVHDLVHSMVTAQPLPDHHVLMPGQQEEALARRAVDLNETDIDDTIWQALNDFVV